MCIAYHSGDAYQNTQAASRFSYYGVGGTPYVHLDGDSQIVGGLPNGTMYPVYRQYFDTRKSVPSPLRIELTCMYDSTSRQGDLGIKVVNETGTALSGQLQVALCESHIYYVWGGLDSLHHVERNMLPDAGGEAVTVPADDSITKTRSFTVDAAWVARNCYLAVFVQDNSSKTIYQGASIGVYQVPALEYRGYQTAYAEPGADVNLTVGLVNRGTGAADSVSAALSTTDPDIDVTTPNAEFGTVALGQDVYSLTPFVIHVDSTHANNSLVTMELAVSGANGYSTSVSFPLLVTTNHGFSDDMERGDNGWAHSGARDNWHQTAHRSQSPSNSWYCGVENSWQYTSENDARLVTPYFVSGDSARLSFDHWHNVEQDYDYCLPEINNGSQFWVPLASYTGASSGWEHVQLPLDAWSGQTIRVGFRFLSDYNVQAEGWYIDNFLFEPYSSGVFEPGPVTGLRSTKLEVRSPVLNRTSIAYAIPAGRSARLAVFDVNGRLVAEIADRLTGAGLADWNVSGLEAGAYFVRLSDETSSRVAKLVVAK
ncbi:Omp28-related outer membrane protein [candidate division WOR-3 bacterium]|nr:Omp28-related outer membrane protein [candidate division WOR-3 bacterium]